MTLAEALLVLLQKAAVPKSDSDEVDRDVRLQKVAFAIGRASELATCVNEYSPVGCRKIASDENLVAAELYWLAEAETAVRSNVHRDECTRYQCDAVRVRTAEGFKTIHLARGLWQPHKPPRWSSARWESIRGDSLEATSNAAWEAAKMLEGYRGMCVGTRGAFAGYATGKRCSHPQAESRARMTERIRSELIRLRASDVGHRPEKTEAHKTEEQKAEVR